MKLFYFSLFVFYFSLNLSAQCLLFDDHKQSIIANKDTPLSSEGCDEPMLIDKPIYPNPTDGFLWSPLDGLVIDMRGRYITNMKKGDNDMRELAQGVYLLINRTSHITLKFAKF